LVKIVKGNPELINTEEKTVADDHTHEKKNASQDGCDIQKRIKLENDQRIIFAKSSQISIKNEDTLCALDNDPNLLFEIPGGYPDLSLLIRISSAQDNVMSSIYYSYDVDPIFSERTKYDLGKVDGKEREFHFQFPYPIRWLRLDPVDRSGEFEINKLSLEISKPEVDPAKTVRSSLIHSLPFNMRMNHFKEQINQKCLNTEKSIVLVTHDITDTGAPLLCQKMSEYLDHNGYFPVIISLDMPSKSDELINRFEKSCEILIVCQNSVELSGYVDILQSVGFNKVVLNSIMSAPALLTFKEAGFKSVMLIHEMKGAIKRLNAQNWVKVVSKFADTIIFPAQCVYDDFNEFASGATGKVAIMPQGYYKNINLVSSEEIKSDVCRKLDIPQNSTIILSAGSIYFGKGLDLLVLIAQHLNTSRLNVSISKFHFLWLGSCSDLSYFAQIEDQIEKMGLTKSFHFLGHITNETEYMNLVAGCSALALVSREDSFPSVMIEAMSCKVPVVAFNKSGGAQELLQDHRGLLVDYMNIEAFSESLDFACSQDEEIEKMTESAYKYVNEKLNFNKYVDKIIDYASNK